ncbi:hypothetical protein BKA69DRAFT_1069750 [Paraphysoderma sedebokerense]|nr:hypothetical protein BKA69DRAFT_1069750 [Paraphysoderma sedebokerense]
MPTSLSPLENRLPPTSSLSLGPNTADDDGYRNRSSNESYDQHQTEDCSQQSFEHNAATFGSNSSNSNHESMMERLDSTKPPMLPVTPSSLFAKIAVSSKDEDSFQYSLPRDSAVSPTSPTSLDSYFPPSIVLSNPLPLPRQKYPLSVSPIQRLAPPALPLPSKIHPGRLNLSQSKACARNGHRRRRLLPRRNNEEAGFPPISNGNDTTSVTSKYLHVYSKSAEPTNLSQVTPSPNVSSETNSSLSPRVSFQSMDGSAVLSPSDGMENCENTRASPMLVRPNTEIGGIENSSSPTHNSRPECSSSNSEYRLDDQFWSSYIDTTTDTDSEFGSNVGYLASDMNTNAIDEICRYCGSESSYYSDDSDWDEIIFDKELGRWVDVKYEIPRQGKCIAPNSVDTDDEALGYGQEYYDQSGSNKRRLKSNKNSMYTRLRQHSPTLNDNAYTDSTGSFVVHLSPDKNDWLQSPPLASFSSTIDETHVPMSKKRWFPACGILQSGDSPTYRLTILCCALVFFTLIVVFIVIILYASTKSLANVMIGPVSQIQVYLDSSGVEQRSLPGVQPGTGKDKNTEEKLGWITMKIPLQAKNLNAFSDVVIKDWRFGVWLEIGQTDQVAVNRTKNTNTCYGDFEKWIKERYPTLTGPKASGKETPRNAATNLFDIEPIYLGPLQLRHHSRKSKNSSFVEISPSNPHQNNSLPHLPSLRSRFRFAPSGVTTKFHLLGTTEIFKYGGLKNYYSQLQGKPENGSLNLDIEKRKTDWNDRWNLFVDRNRNATDGPGKEITGRGRIFIQGEMHYDLLYFFKRTVRICWVQTI